MNKEKSYEELKRENAELRELLLNVCKASEFLDEALAANPDLLKRDADNATVENVSAFKKLLDKYSRL